MNSVQVFELCKKCNSPVKVRLDILGKVNYVDVICKCNRTDENNKKLNCKPGRKYYGEK